MKKAKLFDLLTELEYKYIEKLYSFTNLNTDVDSLSFFQLNIIGAAILVFETKNKVPIILSTYAIEVLVKRAIEKNLSIF